MYTKRGGVAAYHIVCCGRRVVHSTSKNTHTWDAPQTQTDLNNMICRHTTTLSIHTAVV